MPKSSNSITVTLSDGKLLDLDRNLWSAFSKLKNDTDGLGSRAAYSGKVRRKDSFFESYELPNGTRLSRATIRKPKVRLLKVG
jgi:hypothetical protein